MKRHNEYHGRYTTFHLPDIEKCSYESLSDSYICKMRRYSLDEEEDIWSELENFLRIKIYNTLNEEEKNLLTEILYWIEKRDIYSVALLLSLNWEQIEMVFTEKACPDRITGFIVDLRFSIE